MTIPVARIVGWLGRWKIALAIGSGVWFRAVAYASGRGYWIDEGGVILNLRELTPGGFFGPLLSNQLAPPGFLVAAWAMIRLFGDNPYAARLVPFAGGIAGLFLFLALARRCLPDRAVFSAVMMFAVANDPIYYASELKQYSTDLAAGLMCLLAGLTIGAGPLTASRSAWLAAGGAALVWASHPSIFCLAGVGLVGLAGAVEARDRRRAALWGVVGAAWLASFTAVLAVAGRQLAGSRQMWVYWGFAFPPMPPRSAWDLTWLARRLAYFLVNPLNFDAPFGVRASMLPALGLAVLGAARLWRLDPRRWALLMLPVALTLLASSLRLYPFHGRLVLFLVPIPLLAIAAGLDAVRQSRGRRLAYYALAAMVIAVPAWVACERAVDPQPGHTRLGDLHPFDLDPDRFPF